MFLLFVFVCLKLLVEFVDVAWDNTVSWKINRKSVKLLFITNNLLDFPFGRFVIDILLLLSDNSLFFYVVLG